MFVLLTSSLIFWYSSQSQVIVFLFFLRNLISKHTLRAFTETQLRFQRYCCGWFCLTHDVFFSWMSSVCGQEAFSYGPKMTGCFLQWWSVRKCKTLPKKISLTGTSISRPVWHVVSCKYCVWCVVNGHECKYNKHLRACTHILMMSWDTHLVCIYECR